MSDTSDDMSDMLDIYVSLGLESVHIVLTIDSPIIRHFVSKTNHLQPLQLTPPVSLEHLQHKLEELLYATREAEGVLWEMQELVKLRFCIPPVISEGEGLGNIGIVGKGIDCTEDEKKEWVDSIRLWNKGIGSIMGKISGLTDDGVLVDDTLIRFLKGWF
ncbi:MAG: hypothetical protein Q9228_001287 [Teloschistes exilis]